MKSRAVILMTMLVTLLASACATTQPITEPVAVVEAFYEALSDGDLDAALSFVADDARFLHDTLYVGKAQVRDFYETGLASRLLFELSDLRADGEKVSWTETATSSVGAHDSPFEAVVQEGMIVSFIHQ